MRPFTVKSGGGPFVVEGHVRFMGEGLLVALTGGESHIGAVGMAEPRPSMRNPARTSSTSSVFTYTGHKEDIVVKETAELLSKELNRKVVVVAGLHWKDLRGEDIAVIVESCRRLAQMIVERIRKT